MQTYSYKEHLKELKSRFFKVFISFSIAFGCSYYLSEDIYSLLLKPLLEIEDQNIRRIIYTDLTEAFFTYLKLSAFSGLFIIIPIISIQIYFFIRPGLLTDELFLARITLFFSPLLFWLGAFFVYYFVMPKAWGFFLSFESNKLSLPLVLEAKISEYLSLAITLITAFGLAFQLPIIIILLCILKVLNVETLKSKRRIAVVINFIIAGILTPPDIISQFALAIPLLLLYEISIVMCNIIEQRGKNARH